MYRPHLAGMDPPRLGVARRISQTAPVPSRSFVNIEPRSESICQLIGKVRPNQIEGCSLYLASVSRTICVPVNSPPSRLASWPQSQTSSSPLARGQARSVTSNGRWCAAWVQASRPRPAQSAWCSAARVPAGRAPNAEVTGDPLPRPTLAVGVPHLPMGRHALLPASHGHGQRSLGQLRRVRLNRAALGQCVLAPGLLGVPQLSGMTGERQLQRLG
jgi:hypothetical protein